MSTIGRGTSIGSGSTISLAGRSPGAVGVLMQRLSVREDRQGLQSELANRAQYDAVKLACFFLRETEAFLAEQLAHELLGALVVRRPSAPRDGGGPIHRLARE